MKISKFFEPFMILAIDCLLFTLCIKLNLNRCQFGEIAVGRSLGIGVLWRIYSVLNAFLNFVLR